MKKNYKILLLILGIFLVLSIVLGTSYAMWVYSVSQEGENVLLSDCFEITFIDSNDISLANAYPLKDSEGSELTPYTFKIKNICNHAADYDINIETLNSSTLSNNYIKYKLNNKEPKILGQELEIDSSLYVNNGVSKSNNIATGYLGPNQEKEYNLRLWVDINSTKEQSANKTYKSKVVLNATLSTNKNLAMFTNGEDFNNKIQNLASNGSITGIEKVQTEPQESDNYINVATEESKYPIYAWYKDQKIYLYSLADVLYTNSDASGMFSWLDAENLDLSYLNTSRTTNMSEMFYLNDGLKSLNLSSFDTSNVTNMTATFSRLQGITNYDFLNYLDTSNVTTMKEMFRSFGDGNVDVNLIFPDSFNTSNVENMESMFWETNLYKITLGAGFDTSKVTNMSDMFYDNYKLAEIDFGPSFNTSNVTNMYGMLCGTNVTSLDLRMFDTSKVENMSAMISSNHNLTTIDLSSFDTSSVITMEGMFDYSENLTTIYVGNKWDASNVSRSSNMFYGCVKLVGGAGTKYNSSHVDKEYAKADGGTTSPGYFTLKTS